MPPSSLTIRRAVDTRPSYWGVDVDADADADADGAVPGAAGRRLGACARILRRSEGVARALPIEPLAAPASSLMCSGVCRLSVSPNNRLNGSYRPRRIAESAIERN